MSTFKHEPDFFVNILQESGDYTPTNYINSTTKIQEDGDSEFFFLLRKAYSYFDVKSGIENKCRKIEITILNAMRTQNTVVMSINRNSLRSVFRSDENWNTRVGFKNSEYKNIVAFLEKSGVFNILKIGDSNTPGPILLELSKKEFLDFFNDIDTAIQKENALKVWDINSKILFSKIYNTDNSCAINDQNLNIKDTSLSWGPERGPGKGLTSEKKGPPYGDASIVNSQMSNINSQISIVKRNYHYTGDLTNNNNNKIKKNSLKEEELTKIIKEETVCSPNKIKTLQNLKAGVKNTNYFELVDGFLLKDYFNELTPITKKLIESKFNEFVLNLRVGSGAVPKSITDRIKTAMGYISRYGPILKKEAYVWVIHEAFSECGENQTLKQIKKRYLDEAEVIYGNFVQEFNEQNKDGMFL